MKKLVLMSILVGLIAVPAFALPIFSFTNLSQVTGFDKIAAWTNDADADTVATFTDGTFGGSITYTQTYQVGITALSVGEEQGTLMYIGIGDDGFDLAGSYDAWDLTISNDNDDDWTYQAFAFDENSNTATSGWLTLKGLTAGGPEQVTLTVDLTSMTGSNITLGYQVGSGINENQTHTSVVPEPATVVLLGLGSLSLILRRRRVCAHKKG